jgi:hypothetical protein
MAVQEDYSAQREQAADARAEATANTAERVC